MKREYHFVLYVIGLMLVVLGCAMLVPCLLDALTGNKEWTVFLASGGFTIFMGGGLAFSNRGGEVTLSGSTGYLLTAGSWIVLSAFASLPLILGYPDIPFTDAVFETISALTTTGSTVLIGLDNMPPGILMWRSIAQWIGGVGIVLMAMILLPALRVGGMRLFLSESSDISGKPFPRIESILKEVGLVYLTLTVLCTLALFVAGMSFFDAVNHAMATIATGGYSTKDASVGYYHSLPIEIIIGIFMISGALPLIFYSKLFRRTRTAFATDLQVSAFFKVLITAILACAIWNVFENHMAAGMALRQSFFNVTSVLTDTGFATTDFSLWGPFPMGIFFLLLFIGGCAGSTSGAIKIFRWQILFAGLKVQLMQMFSPNRVLVLRYGKRTVDIEMATSVWNFLFIYMLSFAILSLAVMVTGLDFLSSTSAVAQAMANAGPGLGPVVGPGTNFAAIPDTAKWILMLAMISGRLEVAVVYAMFMKEFWRR
ncbi:MAG: TrkH family potassium uptake protein [Alphaproteobacteria bacterium]|nr:MAG: TrkH family potassium uptake protein [Alphaproteobacteria bacterium]